MPAACHLLTNGSTLCSDGEGEDLRNECPGHRAPCSSEARDVYPNESNGGPASGHVTRPIVTELGHDDSDNYHADTHDNRAYQQHGFTADFVYDQLFLALAFKFEVRRLIVFSRDVPWQELC